MPGEIRDQLETPMREVGISEVARRSGVHRPLLSAWLAGRRRINIENLEAVCEALGLEVIIRPRPRKRPRPRNRPLNPKQKQKQKRTEVVRSKKPAAHARGAS